LKKFDGLLSISRVNDNHTGPYMAIRIATKKHNIICEARVELKEFTEALTGLSCTPTKLITYGYDLEEDD